MTAVVWCLSSLEELEPVTHWLPDMRDDMVGLTPGVVILFEFYPSDECSLCSTTTTVYQPIGEEGGGDPACAACLLEVFGVPVRATLEREELVSLVRVLYAIGADGDTGYDEEWAARVASAWREGMTLREVVELYKSDADGPLTRLELIAVLDAMGAMP